MKTDFSINVQISIGVTPDVVALVSSILNRQSDAVTVAPADLAGKLPRRASKRQDPKPEAADDQPAGNQGAGESEQQAAEQQAAEQQAAKDPEPEPAKELTEEDVRAAMDVTRRRIEGEDYKENTAGDQYKKYHKQLTAWFKNISASLGSDKPSTLPADKRAAFIAECGRLQSKIDGTIVLSDAPF